jgi:hypothetical protein
MSGASALAQLGLAEPDGILRQLERATLDVPRTA